MNNAIFESFSSSADAEFYTRGDFQKNNVVDEIWLGYCVMVSFDVFQFLLLIKEKVVYSYYTDRRSFV